MATSAILGGVAGYNAAGDAKNLVVDSSLHAAQQQLQVFYNCHSGCIERGYGFICGSKSSDRFCVAMLAVIIQRVRHLITMIILLVAVMILLIAEIQAGTKNERNEGMRW